jgi:endonuclease YncB( thermonuclease family)
MQVYVYFDGKSHGPYSVDQLRQYLKAGTFKEDHLACYDGQNWVKIRDVPGVSSDIKKTKPGTPNKVEGKQLKKTKKMRAKRLVVVSLCVILALLVVGGSVAGLIYYLIGNNEEVAIAEKIDVFSLTSAQIVDVYDGDTFKIDLPSQHPLFGDDLSIRVLGIDTPEMKGTSDEIKALAYQAKNRTQELLRDADLIVLKNPERGKYFRVVAEVWIDGESLGERLKGEGLAKDYDGEGARPEW